MGWEETILVADQSHRAQAKTSYKAGQKEVVDFIRRLFHEYGATPLQLVSQWQAKLKEWGLE